MGFLVVGLCLLVSAAVAFVLARRYSPELAATQDVVTGLIYFVETSGGQFPPSEAEFRAAPFVETLPDGAIRIRPRADSQYRRETHGIPIRDLAPFAIAWGADFADLRIDEQHGRVVNGAGKEVMLVTWPSSPKSGRGYTGLLRGVAREVQAGAARR